LLRCKRAGGDANSLTLPGDHRLEGVHMNLCLKNGTTEKLRNLRVQNCASSETKHLRGWLSFYFTVQVFTPCSRDLKGSSQVGMNSWATKSVKPVFTIALMMGG
jgi:hypothetical protein